MAFFDCINPCRFGILQCLGQVVVVGEREREEGLSFFLLLLLMLGWLAGWLAGLAGSCDLRIHAVHLWLTNCSASIVC